MKFQLSLIGLASLAMLTGCVPVEKYNALKLQQRADEEARISAEQKLAALQGQLEGVSSSAANANATREELMGALRLANQKNDSQRAELDALQAKYLEAIQNASKAGSIALPPALSSELKNFAAQNPDVVEFDEGRGIVKFKSDVTFDLGSAVLKPKAKEAIDKFAQILASPAAASYELMVAGHTDKTPVSNPETIRQGHKNNWYLSAHRAISVADELMAQKVSSARIGVAGYADQHPIPGATDAANRRVEVMILPTQVRAAATPSGNTPAPKPAPRDTNKDSGGATPPPAAPAIPRDNK